MGEEEWTADKCADIIKYREEYNFIEKLLAPDYYRTVLIPFYLSKANEKESGTSSFVHRLSISDNIKLELEDHTPEFLAREFSTAQNDFTKNVVSVR